MQPIFHKYDKMRIDNPLLTRVVSCVVLAVRNCIVTWVQATVAQQAEMKKIKSLQDKLGAELVSLSQRMADLQATYLDGGQVRQLM